MEVKDILLEGLELCRSTCILRCLTIFGTPAYIDDVSGHRVVPCSAISDLPGVYLGILIVSDKTLYTPIEVDHIRVAYLRPSSPPLGFGRCMPAPDVVTTDGTPLGRSRAVND